MKKKRCLKFTGYLYLPDYEKDKPKDIIYYALNHAGRIEIFDEFNKRTGEKMKAFLNLGQMINYIENEIKKRSRKDLNKIIQKGD